MKIKLTNSGTKKEYVYPIYSILINCSHPSMYKINLPDEFVEEAEDSEYRYIVYGDETDTVDKYISVGILRFRKGEDMEIVETYNSEDNEYNIAYEYRSED